VPLGRSLALPNVFTAPPAARLPCSYRVLPLLENGPQRKLHHAPGPGFTRRLLLSRFSKCANRRFDVAGKIRSVAAGRIDDTPKPGCGGMFWSLKVICHRGRKLK